MEIVLRELPAYSHHIRTDIVMHQEESRTQCTSIGPVSVGLQPKICCITCRGLCVSPWIWLPRPSLIKPQTGHAKQCYRQHHIFHGFSRPFHSCPMWAFLMCSALICEKCRVPVVDLSFLVFNGKCVAQKSRYCSGQDLLWRFPALLELLLLMPWILLHSLETVLEDTEEHLAVACINVPFWKIWTASVGNMYCISLPVVTLTLAKSKTSQKQWASLTQGLCRETDNHTHLRAI